MFAGVTGAPFHELTVTLVDPTPFAVSAAPLLTLAIPLEPLDHVTSFVTLRRAPFA